MTMARPIISFAEPVPSSQKVVSSVKDPVLSAPMATLPISPAIGRPQGTPMESFSQNRMVSASPIFQWDPGSEQLPV